MVDTPKTPEQPDANSELEQKVDKMMDIKGGQPEVVKPEVKGDVSEVAASVNQSLTQNLGTAPELPNAPQEVEPEPEPTQPESEAEPPAEEVKPVDEFDDPTTEKAVDDIAAKEADKLLAVEDAQVGRQPAKVKKGRGFKNKLGNFFHSKKALAVAAVILLILFGLPLTRYRILGLVVKKSVSITVLDSKTATPVSSAEVQLAGGVVKTDANGRAKVHARLGKHDLVVSKRYYQDLKESYFVGFKSTASSVKLVATGRLVPVTVINEVTGQPISNAQVQVAGTAAKTNAKGLATIALPTKSDSVAGKLSLKGFNTADINVKVTDNVVKSNTFELTPAGQIYFLSNAAGKLDVVKTNLDGSGRKTVFEGSGREDLRTTSLLASRDWRFLVLKSRHDGDRASLYLIDTSNDKVTQFDTSDSDFTLVGWYDHDFIYSLTRNDLQAYQAGRQAIKAYDADHQQLNQLDQNQAEGDGNGYAFQNFYGFYILDGVVAYTTEWDRQGVNSGSIDLTGKNDTIRGVAPNGQNKKDYQSFASANTNFIQSVIYQPQNVYYAVYDNNSKQTYYVFDNQSVKTAAITQDAIDQTYPTFLLSPSGKQTFWTELRDGKNTLFTGDVNAQNKKQFAALSDYTPYGWYSDNYVLVSKNSSELYITAPGGLASGKQPVKITDYYKPAQNYSGYGYGYGGL